MYRGMGKTGLAKLSGSSVLLSLSLALALVALLAFAGTKASAQDSDLESSSREVVPLYDNLGSFHYDISSSVEQAQRYFDQGMRLYYAFNHAEAIRAFKAAQTADPDCAICWWGEALAYGPNINLPMDEPSAQAAYQAMQSALNLESAASEKERAMIAALASRYSEDAPVERSELDQAYADAMESLLGQYAQDLDIAVLFAEARLTLRPWDYWNAAKEPQPGIGAALVQLERVIKADETHPGACHFYIHAVEAVYPERAIPCAERLAALMPGAGHLVHMPGHIYIRVGRYLEAVQANEHAVHADESYIQDQHPGMGMYTAGYYPHNYDFMAFAAMMIGRRDLAVDSAEQVTALLPEELFGSPGMDFLQHWLARPQLMRVRFGLWQTISEQEAPEAGYSHSLALWNYAQGRAALGLGDQSKAADHLEHLRELSQDPNLKSLRMEFNLSSQLLAIAERVLSAWVSEAEGDYEAAVAAMRAAVEFEDELFYGEPPEWSVPTRQELGAVLLRASNPSAAEAVFRADLEKFPENGWSLYGLSLALQAQTKQDEAEAVYAQWQRVWATSDVDIADLF